MSKNIFVTREIPDKGIKMLREKGYEVDVRMGGVPTEDEIIEALKAKNYDVVVTLLTDHIGSKTFDAFPDIKMYANYAIGFDNIDVEEAKKRGIAVTNTPGDYAHAIAEHTIALMLGLTTRMVEADKFVRDGKYEGWSPMNFVGTDLKGKTLGLVGVGRIGSRVAKMASKGFDMKVIYTDVLRNKNIEDDLGAVYKENIDEVLREADIISLHVPLLPSTRHLINAEKFKIMKPTSFLINTSRGPVVDELALVKALQDKVIAGAGLDVFEFEPKLAEGLAELNNVVLTPHIASARQSAREEMSEIVALNVIDFFEGREPRNIVNK